MVLKPCQQKTIMAIELEVDGFTIQVPIKEKMKLEEFMEIVERVEAMDGRIRSTRRETRPAIPAFYPAVPTGFSAPAPIMPAMSTSRGKGKKNASASQGDARFDEMLSIVQAQFKQSKEADERLEKHEEHIEQILDYLQSLDKFVRKQ